ncbi:MAG: FtsH protease activity modulator HflK [Verrucomicrobiales bacterium]
MNARQSISPVAILIGLAIFLGIAGVTSAFFSVQADSVGVVLRFGKHDRTMPPGLHFKLPFGVEHVEHVPVERQLKLEFGFGTRDASNPVQVSGQQEDERLMVTGDLNSALVEWVVQYRIADPEQFLFRLRDPELTLRALSESIMRETVGDRTVDEVLTFGRADMEQEVIRKMQTATEAYELGLRIEQVQLKDVNPPRPVQASFDDVNRAQQEREQVINVARADFNRVIPRARGVAQQAISEAEGYATQRVNEAKGDTARFTALLEEYRKAPEVTRTRLYLETMGDVLGRIEHKVILDNENSGVLPLLSLDGRNIIQGTR